MNLDTAIKCGLEDELDHEYEKLLKRVSVIASPLADCRLTKRIGKFLKKCTPKISVGRDVKTVYRGSKAVTRCMKKNLKGVVILGGDTFPIDLISHIPVCCEDRQVPYCYVPSGIVNRWLT
ncbi:H/ACA ribonucleoprotein complex subunit 2-like protein [Thelohanellus kitauei]|uniref:H/ACA ribonucleoprotein complex subunit 2-like protein n=1 Tax=Thelohanellus kitauei TaxID=669202 RepID=A0A0C2MH73_THEKT|nr:H/ACA ribonucleoprotein complex subunit 2-like protein [Thelohanellus kitauei]KII74898.1 H/ACA ribonucleoprotein complex subunit 2-like protein [Thelohanellus kitauei]